jgi:integrase
LEVGENANEQQLLATAGIERKTLGLAGLRPGELAGLQVRHVMREGDVRYFSIEQQFTYTRSKGARGNIDKPKTKWSRRYVPLHRAVSAQLDAWLKSGWAAWVGREPKAEDHVFPDCNGAPYRQHDGDVFRGDLEKADCPQRFNGEPLTPYSLRHMFSTLLTESHAHDAAHDRMMGHRPKDTKTLNYSAKLLPFLATEIERIPFDLPPDAPTLGASNAVASTAAGANEVAPGDAPAA